MKMCDLHTEVMFLLHKPFDVCLGDIFPLVAIVVATMLVPYHLTEVTGTHGPSDEIFLHSTLSMMTLFHGSTFHITASLWGESIGCRWIPLTKGL